MRDHSGAEQTEAVIVGAQVILPDGIEETPVRIAGGQVVEIGGPSSAEVVIDARGLVLAPALIDVHGDAFERQLMPRPGVLFPIDAALLDTDRQLAANGIATAYHALTLSWEPGLRSAEQGAAVIAALDRLRPRLTVENRVQLRWETFALDAVPVIDAALRGPLRPSIAFNDHTSMTLRAFDLPLQTRPFEQGPEFRTCAWDDPRLRDRVAGSAQRAGLSTDAYLELMQSVWARRGEVDGAIRHVAEAGRAVGAPMLSHDDSQLATRRYYRELGAEVAEFPMGREIAEETRAEDGAIVFGAPNALRGGSHIGSLGAGDMVEAGLCDCLASDYVYPAMLGAVARLDAERRQPRHRLWSLVSEGPARAMGLHDRGQIAPGLRADLVLVDWPDGEAPAVRQCWVEGRTAYRALPWG